MTRKICFLTGSRSDYSPLSPVIEAAKLSSMEVQRLETKSLFGNETHVLDELQRLQPDLFVCLGDRLETLLACTLAAAFCIPICHIHGGETTEGAIDDAFRHAISKLSYYHFPCHDRYAKRLQAMGEAPERIFVCGAPGVDGLEELPLNPNENGEYYLCCLHPETLGSDDDNIKEIGDILQGKPQIWASCNQDPGHEKLYNKGINYSRREWLNLMYHAKALVGNSSSFIFEGMTLGKKFINIGERQKGRYEDALEFFKTEPYPYGKPGTVASKIAELLMTLPIPPQPRKPFI